ncbi:MAG: ABC transporter permease [Candidatus Saccharibacteria bacterium]|nr:ABC transporter permease [Candidatus Saccharibacteria bacterium]
MMWRDIKLAIRTMRSAKWRSLMTMTGIILGIVSVVTTLSLGEGIKRQVLKQVASQGSDLITVRPGNFLQRNQDGQISGISGVEKLRFPAGSLSDQDLELINGAPGIGEIAPILSLDSGVSYDGQAYQGGTLIATSNNFLEVIGKSMAHGTFFETRDRDRRVAVIGRTVAEELFKENVPIGRSIEIRGKEYVVKGVVDDFPAPLLGLTPDYNRTVFIPYSLGQQLDSGRLLAMVLVRPSASSSSSELIKTLSDRLFQAHGNQADFTVLGQDENLRIIDVIVDLFSSFIAGVAALSLLIGGIGIMNIMTVLVGERTREIGIRKAIGATNRQIASQFFAEALLLSLVGGLLGIGLAGIVNLSLLALTHLQPVITWQMLALAGGVSLGIGIVFGLAPAIRAARKDPIESLRYE